MSDRQARADRLAPYFEIQLRLAGRMAALTGAPLGETALAYSNLHRRLGFGVHRPAEAPTTAWRGYVAELEAAGDLDRQLAVTSGAFLRAQDEHWPLAGQTGFGCFACEPPDAEGVVRVHFYNLDTDDEGGPLASAKLGRRRGDLAALTRHILTTWPRAHMIRGRSWLYNLEAYRRLFPADYAASARPAPGPLRLNGTSSWGQLIDSQEAIRPQVRDSLAANLETLDPARPWTVFPYRVLATEAPLASFAAAYGL